MILSVKQNKMIISCESEEEIELLRKSIQYEWPRHIWSQLKVAVRERPEMVVVNIKDDLKHILKFFLVATVVPSDFSTMFKYYRDHL